MGIYWKHIDPEMEMLGPVQQFIFNQNLNQFQIQNTFVPTLSIPSESLLELRNNGLSGFRFRHVTASGDTTGALKIQSFVGGSPSGTDLMSFNQDGTITLDAGLIFDDLNFTKLGIGANPVDDGTIKFSNDNNFQKKIILWDINGNSYQYTGLGVDGANFLYLTPASHLFLIGKSSSSYYCGLSINSDGNVGLGNYQSATSSRLFINGGPTLDATGEESAIRVENSNLSSTTIKIQLVHKNAKNWELRSNSNGSFEIYDRFGLTSRFLIGSTGDSVLNGALSLLNHKIINVLDPTSAQDAATKAYVDSAIDNSFGPDVALPFERLSFNWSYAGVTDPSPYEFVNNFTDSRISKNFKYRIATADTSAREWNHDYTLIGNSDLNGIYNLNYKVLSSTYTPLSIAIYPFAPSQNLMTIGVPINMGGFEIRNALDPTTAQSLATKSYVDAQVVAPLTLTGAITGSGASPIVTTLASTAGATWIGNIIGGQYGGTGVNNGARTITINGGNFATSGGQITLTATATTNVTLPTTGTLATLGNRLDQFAVPTSALNINNQALNNVLSISFATSSIDSSGNAIFSNTIYGRRVSGLMTMQGNAIGTTVTTGGQFYKVAGTTVSSSLNQLTMPVSNRFTYVGVISGTVTAFLSVFLTASHNGGPGDEIQFALYKNGIQISNSIISGEGSNNTPRSYSLGTIVSMSTNDFIEIYCSHPANGKVITVKNMIFMISTT